MEREGDALLNPETMFLWLPLSIKDLASHSAVCSQSFHNIETQHQYAQLVTTLAVRKQRTETGKHIGSGPTHSNHKSKHKSGCIECSMMLLEMHF
jgi:hypothetical protein